MAAAVVELKSIPLSVVQAEAASMAGQLKGALVDGTLSWSALPGVVARAMELAERLRLLSGAEKKKLVVEAVVQLIAQLGSDTPLSAADPVLVELLPTLIDQVIAASKCALELNKKVKSCCFF